MFNRIRLAVFILACISCQFALADDKEEITKRFSEYRTQSISGDFYQASKYIAPDDLERAKNAFLPVFLDAAKSSSSGVRQQADLFFGNIRLDRRPALSSNGAYAGILRIGLAAVSPQLLQLMRSTAVKIIKIDLGSQQEATLYYSVQFLNGYKMQGTENFKKVHGVWYLRLKNVEENAAKIKATLDKFNLK